MQEPHQPIADRQQQIGQPGSGKNCTDDHDLGPGQQACGNRRPASGNV